MINQETKIPVSKLVILFLFNTLNITLNEHQVVRILTNHDWANYFDIKDHLFELVETEMLSKRETPHGVFYTITPLGTDSINLFYKDIMLSVRENIDSFSKQNGDTLNREADLYSDYIMVSDTEFRVTLKILDKTQPTFELDLLVYSKDEAETLIRNWNISAKGIYQHIYTELMKG